MFTLPELKGHDKARELRKERLSNGTSNHGWLTAVVFARPSSEFVSKHMLPHLGYWDARSALKTHFYYAGFSNESKRALEEVALDVPGFSQKWFYSDFLFNEDRRQLQHNTTWQYGGGLELLLLNTHHNNLDTRSQYEPPVNYSSVLCCRLDNMLKDGAIHSVEQFFESIFSFSERTFAEDPVWGFSDKRAIEIGGSALKRAVLSLLPKLIAEEYAKAEHFAVRDLVQKSLRPKKRHSPKSA